VSVLIGATLQEKAEKQIDVVSRFRMHLRHSPHDRRISFGGESCTLRARGELMSCVILKLVKPAVAVSWLVSNAHGKRGLARPGQMCRTAIPYQTFHRRFQQWARSGILKGVLEALALDLKRGAMDVREAFIDGSFAVAKKGVTKLGKPSAAKAQRSWPLQDRKGLPVAVHVESATPHESQISRSHLGRDGDCRTSSKSDWRQGL
jgi:hypothetical protein